MLGQGLGQNQNLINPIRIEKVESLGKPPGFYKSIVIDILGILAAFFTGYAYLQFLGGIWTLLAPIGASLAFAIVITIEALLERGVTRRIGMLIVETIALLAPFYAFDVRLLTVCAVAAAALFLVGYLQCRSELNHGMTIHFFRATHGVVAKFVTAALLVAIMLYLPMARTGTIFVSEPAFGGFFDWVAGLVSGFYPAVSFTGSFGDFAQSVAKGELATNAAFQSMSSSGQVAALSAASSQIESNLSKSLGITISGASPTSNVAYDVIMNMLQGLRDRFSLWFVAGWGIVLFLLLRSVGVVAVWIGQFLAMIAYEILLSTGTVRITEEPQTKEIIGY